ncbi:cystatin-B-like protein [Pelagophyceae sp. CCMP2097]|nr:cystatin-B-like protein [Pelagophyceae sp. CCMP2097]
MVACGGFGAEQECTEEVHAIAQGVKAAIEAHLSEEYAVFEPKAYSSQVVAGTNYAISIHVGDGKMISAKIHKPLPHTSNPPKLMEAAKL